MSEMKVYLVEDDESIRELVLYALKNSGFQAAGFDCGEKLFAAMETSLPQLILLDIMLPGEDGLSILSRLRSASKTCRIPIIMLTAKSSEYDKVKGLDLGADDYITKPFGVMELISRINAVARRTYKPEEQGPVLTFGNVTVDISRHRVLCGDEPVHLTLKEFELLSCLLQNRGIVLTRDKIMELVWGFDFEGESRTVDIHINTLRKKLGESGAIIETVRGIGYKVGG